MRAQVNIEATLTKATTGKEPNTVKLIFDSQEIPPEKLTSLILMGNLVGNLAFSPDPIAEVLQSPESKATDSKWTPSQRLRFALHDYFINTHNGDPNDKEAFNKFYEEEILHLVRLVNEFNSKKDERGFW